MMKKLKNISILAAVFTSGFIILNFAMQSMAESLLPIAYGKEFMIAFCVLLPMGSFRLAFATALLVLITYALNEGRKYRPYSMYLSEEPKGLLKFCINENLVYPAIYAVPILWLSMIAAFIFSLHTLLS